LFVDGVREQHVRLMAIGGMGNPMMEAL